MTRTTRYLDLALRGSMVALFVIAGVMKLMAHPFEVQSFDHFGYAPWFMFSIGAFEILGGLALLRAQWVLAAIMLLGTILIGAIGSHLHVGDRVAHIVPAVVALSILAGTGLIRRPSRASQAT